MKSESRPSATSIIALDRAGAGAGRHRHGPARAEQGRPQRFEEGCGDRRGRLKKAAVNSRAIADAAVTRDKIADGAVNGAKVEDGSIGPEDLSTVASGGTSAQRAEEGRRGERRQLRGGAARGAAADAGLARDRSRSIRSASPTRRWTRRTPTPTSPPPSRARCSRAARTPARAIPSSTPTPPRSTARCSPAAPQTPPRTGFRNQFDAAAPSGALIQGQVTNYAKNGTLPGGDGIYGAGDVCLFGVSIAADPAFRRRIGIGCRQWPRPRRSRSARRAPRRSPRSTSRRSATRTSRR